MDQRTARIAEDVKDIVQTRTAISETLNLIERRLTGSIEEAKHTASDFVDHAKSTVEDAVASTKQAIDPIYQAKHHPWLFLGGAVLVGFAIEAMITTKPKSYRYYPPGTSGVSVMPQEGQRAQVRSGVYSYYPERRNDGDEASAGPETSGLLTEQLGVIKHQLAVAASTLASAWIRDSVPLLAKKFGVTVHPEELNHSFENKATTAGKGHPDATQVSAAKS